MAEIRVGVFAPVGPFASATEHHKVELARIGELGVDHVCVNDHVSFFIGAGSDALINATSLLTYYPELPCYVALYLLPLRHPVLVARQLASIAELAPGRLTLGVGIGGEDRHELEICGVDPRTVGRRMDESLQILRALSDGKPVSFDSEFFLLHDALIVPPPFPPIPSSSEDGPTPRCGVRDGSATAGWASGSRLGDSVRWSNRSPSTPAALAGTRAVLSMPSMSGAASAPPAPLPARPWLLECKVSIRCHSSLLSAIRLTGTPRCRRIPSPVRRGWLLGLQRDSVRQRP